MQCHYHLLAMQDESNMLIIAMDNIGEAHERENRSCDSTRRSCSYISLDLDRTEQWKPQLDEKYNIFAKGAYIASYVGKIWENACTILNFEVYN